MTFDFDRTVLHLLSPVINSPAGDAWSAFADIAGNGGWLALAAVIAGLAGIYFKRERLKEGVISILTALEVSGIIVQVLKLIIGRARPKLDIYSLSFTPFSTANNWHSFPSGHAASCFVFAASMSFFYPRYSVLWYFVAFFTALGRVIGESHFLTDIMGGALLGIVTGFMAAKIIHERFFQEVNQSDIVSS